MWLWCWWCCRWWRRRRRQRRKKTTTDQSGGLDCEWAPFSSSSFPPSWWVLSFDDSRAEKKKEEACVCRGKRGGGRGERDRKTNERGEVKNWKENFFPLFERFLLFNSLLCSRVTAQRRVQTFVKLPSGSVLRAYYCTETRTVDVARPDTSLLTSACRRLMLACRLDACLLCTRGENLMRNSWLLGVWWKKNNLTDVSGRRQLPQRIMMDSWTLYVSTVNLALLATI